MFKRNIKIEEVDYDTIIHVNRMQSIILKNKLYKITKKHDYMLAAFLLLHHVQLSAIFMHSRSLF